jgi:hypothetical protein
MRDIHLRGDWQPQVTLATDIGVLTQRTRSELRITERHAELDLAARRDELKDEARERRRAAAQRRRLARVDRRGQRCGAAAPPHRGSGAAATPHRRGGRRQCGCSADPGEHVLGVVVPVEAMRSAGLTLPLAGTVATALESLGLTFAGLAHQARAANDSAAVYRAAMWAVVAVASAVNYRHGSAGWQQPGLTGIVFATLSVGSVAGWELRERQTYRRSPTGSPHDAHGSATHNGSSSHSPPPRHSRSPSATASP